MWNMFVDEFSEVRRARSPFPDPLQRECHSSIAIRCSSFIAS